MIPRVFVCPVAAAPFGGGLVRGILMTKRQLSSFLTAAVLSAAGLLALPAAAQTRPAPRVVPHSDTAFARDLYRLSQADLIKAAESESKGTRSEPLWHAAAIAANWDEIAKNRADLNNATREYLASLGVYLDAQRGPVDGTWALDNAKFIFAMLSKPVIDRMEYFANSEKDRTALAPMAQTADRLLKTALEGLNAEMEILGSNVARAKFPSEEAYNNAYMKAYGATVEVEYYNAWAKYFLAMSMEPGKPERNTLLDQAATTLGKWADDAEDNGVNSQALLLRGKALSESGKIDQALVDLKKTQAYPNAPEWVKYQARYQAIVAELNARDFKQAHTDFAAFRAPLKDNKDALVSADLLDYRIAWTEAEALPEGKARQDGRLAALKILAGIIERDPRKEVRYTVYDQLAAQIPENAPFAGLMPMQQLAVAYSKSMGQKGETPESRKSLQAAVNAAVAVLANKDATAPEQLDATFLAGVCNAMLGQLMEAAKYNIDFASRAPTDPRAKELTELALQQIGELIRIAPNNVSPELRNLKERALDLAAGKFNDKRWDYARAVSTEDSGKLVEAYKLYERVGTGDKNYLDARYHMISVSLQRLNQLTGKAADPDIKAAAADLFNACSKYVSLIDAPPAGTPPEALERAKGYRNDIWIIEIAAALNPSVKRSEIALDRIKKLEAVAGTGQLSDKTKGALLRYKIQAYQQGGQPEKAVEVVKEYAKSQGAEASATIANFVYSLIEEINQTEKSDHAAAQRLASSAVDLLAELIKSSEKDPALTASLYGFRQLQSDMMVRAHRAKEAIALAKKLQEEKPPDLFNFMTEARAMFVAAEESGKSEDFSAAQDYFTRILPKLDPSGDSYWECYLHIIACKTKLGGPTAAAEIKKSLSDLKAVHGSKVGGKKYKEEFDALMQKYGVI